MVFHRFLSMRDCGARLAHVCSARPLADRPGDALSPCPAGFAFHRGACLRPVTERVDMEAAQASPAFSFPYTYYIRYALST